MKIYEKYPKIYVESINATKNEGSYLKMLTGRSYLNFGTPCTSNVFFKNAPLIVIYTAKDLNHFLSNVFYIIFY